MNSKPVSKCRSSPTDSTDEPTFLAHALGHVACRRGATVFAVRTNQMLKTLKHARLDNSYDAELRKFVAVDLLILDDFAIDVLDPVESRDLYDLLVERYRSGSIVVTSNRGPDEWLATFADPMRAESAIDRFTSNAYHLVIEGESYRPRLKPRLPKEPTGRTRGSQGLSSRGFADRGHRSRGRSAASESANRCPLEAAERLQSFLRPLEERECDRQRTNE